MFTQMLHNKHVAINKVPVSAKKNNNKTVQLEHQAQVIGAGLVISPNKKKRCIYI
jgi:hypothetical protein